MKSITKIFITISLAIILALPISIGVFAEDGTADAVGGIRSADTADGEISDNSVNSGKEEGGSAGRDGVKSDVDRSCGLEESDDALTATDNADVNAAITDDGESAEKLEETNANPGEAILSAITSHSGEILSLLAFIGSIILAFAYKLGLTPLIRGTLSSMLSSVGVLKDSVASSDEKCSLAVSRLESRLTDTEDIIKRLDEAIALTSEKIKAEESSKGERADLRLIMQMQINMLYDIFMTSALPQYEKDAVGERISAMNKILTNREKEDLPLPSANSDIGE